MSNVCPLRGRSLPKVKPCHVPALCAAIKLASNIGLFKLLIISPRVITYSTVSFGSSRDSKLAPNSKDESGKTTKLSVFISNNSVVKISDKELSVFSIMSSDFNKSETVNVDFTMGVNICVSQVV